VCQSELAELVLAGVTPIELQRAKGQVKGGTVLGQEDTGARMSRIAKAELYDEELIPIQEALTSVDKVDAASVNALAQEFLANPLAMSVIGPYKKLPVHKGFVTPLSNLRT
jgi:predicted Zn-dependent peptidase